MYIRLCLKQAGLVSNILDRCDEVAFNRIKPNAQVVKAVIASGNISKGYIHQSVAGPV